MGQRDFLEALEIAAECAADAFLDGVEDFGRDFHAGDDIGRGFQSVKLNH
jgi:hypothetical protein